MRDRPYRLLLVEDSAEDRCFYRQELSAAGEGRFQLLEVDTGQAGLWECRSSPPDCILLDYQLPDMDGLEFLASLKGGNIVTPVPVVVLTGQGSEAIAVEAMKSGAHDYLTKGAPGEQLVRAIDLAIARHAGLPSFPYKILIIDDSTEDRVAYRRCLVRANMTVEFREAETGEDGLQACREFLPDCVLIDYQLPDTDGLEVVKSLVREHGSSEIAILMLTGHGNESLAVQALKAGAEDYIVKGGALEGLPQAVRLAVEKVSLRRRLERQQKELERSRNELRVTLSSIGDAVLATDLAGRIVFLNPVAECLTGWRSAEARGKPLDDVFVIVSEESRLPAENPALRALREGAIVGLSNHTLLISRDGREIPIDDSAAPIKDEDGKVFGSVLVFRDVTERRRAEESLLLQSRLLESMTEGVSVSDEEGIIYYTNPAEDRMFGYARGELVGKHIGEQNAYPSEEHERRVQEVIGELKRKGSWTGEWRNRRKNGESFYSYSRITSLEVAGRKSFLCVQEDVTDRKRLEDELQRRVAQLALADKRKDEFLAMLAHELRNPLAPLKTSLHLLKLKNGDADTVAHVRGVMERQVGHLVRLVDDLLDVSRITQGKVTLQRERLNLSKLIDDCLADHSTEFESAGVSLESNLPREVLLITGDRTRLTQVVDNFLTNACKFTNRGGHVHVNLSVEGGKACLSVRDDGVGIEPELLDTVFDVFAQADKSLDRASGGLGLGLAIVKGLVELHGGSVVARSDGMGKGTEVIAYLPLGEEERPASVAQPPAKLRQGRGRVLVVEDNRDSAESLRLLLEMSGYEVRLAFNGAEGFKAAEAWGPSAVVCDVGLPEVDGFALARMLRRSPGTQNAFLIAVTGYGRVEDIQQARLAGFDDHLVKPADPEKLLEKLGHAV